MYLISLIVFFVIDVLGLLAFIFCLKLEKLPPNRQHSQSTPEIKKFVLNKKNIGVLIKIIKLH